MTAKFLSSVQFGFAMLVVTALLAAGIGAQWLPGGNAVIGIKALGYLVVFLTIIVVPMWMSGGCHVLKMAIDSIQKNEFDRARFYLISRSWMIFPLPKYAEIIQLLRRFCEDQSHNPTTYFPQFTAFFVKDGFNQYVLTEEGRDKMVARVNSGWITGEFFESPKYLKLLLRLTVAMALIRILIAIIDFFIRHHR